jgi:hypothetical protein
VTGQEEPSTSPPGEPPQAGPSPAEPSRAEPPPLAGPVGPLEIIGRGLDVNVAASSDVRRVAILIGLLALAAAGPIVALELAASGLIGAPSSDGPYSDIVALQGRLNAARILVELSALIGIGCVIALAIDSQLLAVHVIASRATGRAFSLRPALEVVRIRFWRLARANILVGLILFIPRAVIERILAPRGIALQSQSVVQVILDIILSVPFAYLATWILLGQVGAREAVRRSWRLARSRPSLALVIAIVNVAFQTIALVALGSAAEILVRIADALGLDHATGLGIVPLGALLALAIVATGSLVMTIAALTVGPQVVAFLRLTGTDGGLVALHDPDNPFATPRVEPLVSRPMKIALVVEAVLAALAFFQLT